MSLLNNKFVKSLNLEIADNYPNLFDDWLIFLDTIEDLEEIEAVEEVKSFASSNNIDMSELFEKDVTNGEPPKNSIEDIASLIISSDPLKAEKVNEILGKYISFEDIDDETTAAIIEELNSLKVVEDNEDNEDLYESVGYGGIRSIEKMLEGKILNIDLSESSLSLFKKLNEKSKNLEEIKSKLKKIKKSFNERIDLSDPDQKINPFEIGSEVNYVTPENTNSTAIVARVDGDSLVLDNGDRISVASAKNSGLNEEYIENRRKDGQLGTQELASLQLTSNSELNETLNFSLDDFDFKLDLIRQNGNREANNKLDSIITIDLENLSEIPDTDLAKAYNQLDSIIDQFNLNEGTWAFPKDKNSAEKLQKLMSKPLPSKGATEKLYNIFGDDDLFDSIEEFETDDVRVSIFFRLEEFLNTPEVVKEINSDAMSILKEIVSDESLFESSEQDGLISTYSDAVVYNENGEILLLQRNLECEFEPNKWGFPGGKVMPGETTAQAAIRETHEECGVIAKLDSKLAEIANGGDMGVSHYYKCIAENDVTLGDEHQDYAWVKPEEVEGYDLIMDNTERFGDLVTLNSTQLEEKYTVSNLNESFKKEDYLIGEATGYLIPDENTLKSVGISKINKKLEEWEKQLSDAQNNNQERISDELSSAIKAIKSYLELNESSQGYTTYTYEVESDIEEAKKIMNDLGVSYTPETEKNWFLVKSFDWDTLSKALSDAGVDHYYGEGGINNNESNSIDNEFIEGFKEMLGNSILSEYADQIIPLKESAIDDKISELIKQRDDSNNKEDAGKLQDEIDKLKNKKLEQSKSNILNKISEYRNRIEEKQTQLKNTDDTDLKIKIESQIKEFREKIDKLEQEAADLTLDTVDKALSRTDDFLGESNNLSETRRKTLSKLKRLDEKIINRISKVTKLIEGKLYENREINRLKLLNLVNLKLNDLKLRDLEIVNKEIDKYYAK